MGKTASVRPGIVVNSTRVLAEVEGALESGSLDKVVAIAGALVRLAGSFGVAEVVAEGDEGRIVMLAGADPAKLTEREVLFGGRSCEESAPVVFAPSVWGSLVSGVGRTEVEDRGPTCSEAKNGCPGAIESRFPGSLRSSDALGTVFPDLASRCALTRRYL